MEALYAAVVRDRVGALVDEATESIAGSGDPAAGFFAFFTRIVEDSTRKKMPADALTDAGVPN